MARSSLAVEDMSIDAVTPYAKNPRRNAGAVAKVAASLKEFGWRQPIVVDETKTVIVGHTRLAAARSLGMATVPVHVARGLSEAQVRAYRLADNRTGEEAEWDSDLLAGELSALRDLYFDLVSTGFESDELGTLLDGGGSAGGGDATVEQLGAVEYQIVVSCAGEHAQANLCQELEQRGFKCRLLTL